VLVTVTGVYDLGTLKPMVTEARSVAGPLGFDLLYDYRGAVPGDLKVTDLFWFPRNTPALTGPEARQMRIATVYLPLPAHRELMQFWETSYNNLGLPARAFEDEAQAYAWLAS
jgi:hypothetical protein